MKTMTLGTDRTGSADSILRAARCFFAGFYCYAYFYYFGGKSKKSLTGPVVC